MSAGVSSGGLRKYAMYWRTVSSPFAAQLVVKIQPFKIAARAVYPHQADAVGFVQSVAQGRQTLGPAGLRRELRDQPAGFLQQRSGGSSILIAHDLSIRRIGRLERDAGHRQRLAVGPRGMARVGLQEDRPAKHHFA